MGFKHKPQQFAVSIYLFFLFSGHFMYVEATGAASGEKTTLRSTYYRRQTFTQCLTFWYHMYGSNIGTLNVYATTFFFRQQVWSKTGSQGNLWRKAQVRELPWIVKELYRNLVVACDTFSLLMTFRSIFKLWHHQVLKTCTFKPGSHLS